MDTKERQWELFNRKERREWNELMGSIVAVPAFGAQAKTAMFHVETGWSTVENDLLPIGILGGFQIIGLRLGTRGRAARAPHGFYAGEGVFDALAGFVVGISAEEAAAKVFRVFGRGGDVAVRLASTDDEGEEIAAAIFARDPAEDAHGVEVAAEAVPGYFGEEVEDGGDLPNLGLA